MGKACCSGWSSVRIGLSANVGPLCAASSRHLSDKSAPWFFPKPSFIESTSAVRLPDTGTLLNGIDPKKTFWPGMAGGPDKTGRLGSPEGPRPPTAVRNWTAARLPAMVVRPRAKSGHFITTGLDLNNKRD